MGDREELTEQKLRQLAETEDDRERERLCDEIVLLNRHVAQSIARRYRRRGAEFDGLAQFAHLGLVTAVDRYEPDSGSHFVSFAVPMITGEVERFFRDCCWTIARPADPGGPARHRDRAARTHSAAGSHADGLGVGRGARRRLRPGGGGAGQRRYFNLASLDMLAGRGEASRSLADEVGQPASVMHQEAASAGDVVDVL